MRVPSDTFSVRVKQSNGALHLRLSGRFDSGAVAALDGLIGVGRSRDVVMDLERITFIDGAAWVALMAYDHRVHDWGKDLRLVNTPAHLRRIFELTATEHLLAEAVGR